MFCVKESDKDCWVHCAKTMHNIVGNRLDRKNVPVQTMSNLGYFVKKYVETINDVQLFVLYDPSTARVI